MPGVKWVESRHLVTMADNVKVTTAIGYTPVLTLAQIEVSLIKAVEILHMVANGVQPGIFTIRTARSLGKEFDDLLAQVQAWKEGK